LKQKSAFFKVFSRKFAFAKISPLILKNCLNLLANFLKIMLKNLPFFRRFFLIYFVKIFKKSKWYFFILN